MKTRIYIFKVLIITLLFVMNGCKKEVPMSIPNVTTTIVTDISLTSAISGGVITSIDKSNISSRGVCWSTNEIPTINESKTIDGSGIGVFSSVVENLVANQTYYLRAYAINEVGIGYGNIFKFTTKDDSRLTNSEQLYPGIKGTEISVSLFGATVKCLLINKEFVYQGDILIANSLSKGSSSSEVKKWPNNTIYYTLNNNLQNKQIIAVRDAINEFQSKTNLIFKIRTNEKNYIEFIQDPNGCTSIVGMNSYYTLGQDPTIYDHNYIRLAYWATSGTVLHEIGHAVGLFHEHGKPNRDVFIEIKTENIIEDHRSQFNIDGGNLNTSGFDWESIMLYPSISSFSIDNKPTMVRKSDGKPFESNRSFLSDGDIYLINLMYPTTPKVSTLSISLVTNNTANCTGEVLDDGGWNVYERGVCWSANPSPTIQDNKITSGNGLGSFSCNLTGLSPSTTYYARAYALNSSGIGPGYGEVLSFKTLETLKSPSVSTTEPSEIMSNSAKIGGNITSDGGSTITDRGIYYSTNIVSNGTKLQIGSGTGAFSTTLTGLTPNTTYYVKAYATNSIGTSYGSILTFKTDITAQSPSVTTSAPTNITSNSSTLGGNVTSAGSSAVLERGVVYSTTQNPSTSNTKIVSGSGIGAYTVNATSLNANTTYYVRAYAINSQGTGYGTEQNFSTVTAGVAPVAAFTANTTTIKEGDNVQFTDQSTNNPTSWSWDFGDGSTSTYRSPSHIFATAGSYTVSLTATNGYGSNSMTKTNYITVNSVSGGIIFNPALTYGSVTDIDGNVYKTIQIGAQTWMAENLKTTKYKDGASIPLVTVYTEWDNLVTPGYCWYDNQISYKELNGALYNWYAANTGKLCPTGWHVPTDAEWRTLAVFLGGEDVAGGKLKETGTSHWFIPNTGATNSSGFTAIPSGGRHTAGLNFNGLGSHAIWWSHSTFSSRWNTFYGGIGFYPIGDMESSGLSVRCVKD